MRMVSPQDPPAFAALEWPGDVREPPSPAWWPFALGGLALAVGIAWWRHHRVPAARGVVAASTGSTALQQLQALALPATGHTLAFYVQLKALLRLHCRERFALRAEQATSEELVAALPRAAALQQCLGNCDRVLFAAGEPGVGGPAHDRDTAIAFVRATSAEDAA